MGDLRLQPPSIDSPKVVTSLTARAPQPCGFGALSGVYTLSVLPTESRILHPSEHILHGNYMPLTIMNCPVTQSASSGAKKTTALAMSAGVPILSRENVSSTITHMYRSLTHPYNMPFHPPCLVGKQPESYCCYFVLRSYSPRTATSQRCKHIVSPHSH
jgi:hypothetical protein